MSTDHINGHVHVNFGQPWYEEGPVNRYLRAARVPESLTPQAFGPWHIRRVGEWQLSDLPWRKQLEIKIRMGFPNYTSLMRRNWARLENLENFMETDPFEIVMEDSREELCRHLPIWLRARGRVLVTGLGLGCVVRGLLAKKEVEHVTVVEIDASILRIIGHEFASNRRVTLVHCDALNWQPNGHKFDYAWHDLHTDGEKGLHLLHAKLFAKYHGVAAQQGAWQFPKCMRRKYGKVMNLFFR